MVHVWHVDARLKTRQEGRGEEGREGEGGGEGWEGEQSRKFTLLAQIHMCMLLEDLKQTSNTI